MNKYDLHFDKSGEFKIMVVGDIHESCDYSTKHNKARFNDYIRLQKVGIDKIKPNLAVIMGDMINSDNYEDLEKGIKNITSPFVEKGVPFALVRGNHDAQNGMPWEVHEKLYKSIPGCFYCPDEKNSNERHDYNLMIKSSDGKKDVFNLWFVNCGKTEEYDTGYDYARDYQIKWYEDTCDKITKKNKGRVIPSILFQHIPVCEEYKLLNEHNKLGSLFDCISDDKGKKSKFFNLNKKLASGYLGERPCSADYNSGQFESWKKKGDVIAAVFGHDHMNDFVGKVDGILLCQCKLAGFGAYGDGLQQGHRVITLHEDEPYKIGTEMRRYREMIGMDCESIHGRVKYVHDRVGIKIDVAKIILGVAAGIGVLCFGIKKLIEFINRK